MHQVAPAISFEELECAGKIVRSTVAELRRLQPCDPKAVFEVVAKGLAISHQSESEFTDKFVSRRSSRANCIGTTKRQIESVGPICELLKLKGSKICPNQSVSIQAGLETLSDLLEGDSYDGLRLWGIFHTRGAHDYLVAESDGLSSHSKLWPSDSDADKLESQNSDGESTADIFGQRGASGLNKRTYFVCRLDDKYEWFELPDISLTLFNSLQSVGALGKVKGTFQGLLSGDPKADVEGAPAGFHGKELDLIRVMIARIDLCKATWRSDERGDGSEDTNEEGNSVEAEKSWKLKYQIPDHMGSTSLRIASLESEGVTSCTSSKFGGLSMFYASAGSVLGNFEPLERSVYVGYGVDFDQNTYPLISFS